LTRSASLRIWDRLFWILFSRWWPQWQDSLIIVQPETVLRWRREGWTKSSARFDDDLRVYAAFARHNGAPPDLVQRAVEMQRDSLYGVLPEREEALLSEAGFVGARLFYAGLSVFGWIARA
jgi:hypothetical protein